jgi:hypothetical protein
MHCLEHIQELVKVNLLQSCDLLAPIMLVHRVSHNEFIKIVRLFEYLVRRYQESRVFNLDSGVSVYVQTFYELSL